MRIETLIKGEIATIRDEHTAILQGDTVLIVPCSGDRMKEQGYKAGDQVEVVVTSKWFKRKLVTI